MPKMTTIMMMVLIVTLLAGCSLGFTGIVYLNERQATRQAQISVEELDSLEPGTVIVIIGKVGNDITGQFVGIEKHNQQEMPAILVNSDGAEMSVPLSQDIHIELDRNRYSIIPAFVLGGAFDALALHVMLNWSPNIDLNF